MSAMTKLQSLISDVSKMKTEHQRAIWSVVGSCVADAATRPTHWCYDRTKLEASLGDSNPEFWPESLSPFYTIPTGENSCYNDMGIVMLQSLPNVGSEDSLSHDEYKARLISTFGLGSAYDDAYKRRQEAYDPAKRYQERKPVEGPWIQHSLVEALPALLNGEVPSGCPENAETDGLVSTLPLIALLTLRGVESDSLEFQTSIKEAASIVSTNTLALYHTLTAAAILQEVILKGEAALTSPCLLSAVNKLHSEIVAEEDIELMCEELSTLMAAACHKQSNHTNQVEKWGKTCSNPGSFMGAMHAVLTSLPSGGKGYCGGASSSASGSESSSVGGSIGFVECVRKTIRAGGCNCSRANLAGALMGALYGVSNGSGSSNGIPVEWIEKSSKGLEVLQMAVEKFRNT